MRASLHDSGNMSPLHVSFMTSSKIWSFNREKAQNFIESPVSANLGAAAKQKFNISAILSPSRIQTSGKGYGVAHSFCTKGHIKGIHVDADLKSTPMVALTTDGWTSKGTINFITIMDHTMSDDFKLNKYVPQSRAIDKSHTGIHIAEVLVDMVKEWQLTDPYGPMPVVTDSMSNLSGAAWEAEGIGPHICFCFAHTISQSKGVESAAGHPNVRACEARGCFFPQEHCRCTLLKKKQELLQHPQHKLIADIATRWKASYDILQRYSE